MSSMRPQHQSKEIHMTAIEAFTPVILNQIACSVFFLAAVGIAITAHDTLKKIRGRHRRLRFAPRYALAYVGKLAQSS